MPSRKSSAARAAIDVVRAPVVLTIPGAVPSKGNSYRIGKRKDGTAVLVKGRRHAGSSDVGAFEGRALQALVDAAVRPFLGPVLVEAFVYPPDDRRDVPGAEKALLDALQTWRKVGRQRVPNPGGVGCYPNDKQVRRLDIDFGGVDAACPRVELRVSPWTPRVRPW